MMSETLLAYIETDDVGRASRRDGAGGQKAEGREGTSTVYAELVLGGDGSCGGERGFIHLGKGMQFSPPQGLRP